MMWVVREEDNGAHLLPLRRRPDPRATINWWHALMAADADRRAVSPAFHDIAARCTIHWEPEKEDAA